jgi:hypothetical protein
MEKNQGNAILLCANCHKIIDNPENTKYTIEKLHQIKATHEAWIAEKLEEDTKESMELKRRIEEVSLKFDEFVRLREQEIELSEKQMNRERVIETLKEFISFLISNLEGKIEEVDRYLNADRRLALTLIRPKYEYAYPDVLGDYGWIKEKVEEYNDLVRDEELEKARETTIELKKRLEELKSKLLIKYSITRKDVERTAHTPYVIREKKRTKEDER